MTVLFQVLTLFLLMLCGLIAVKTRLISQRDVGVMNTFVLNFAQVGLIIDGLQRKADPQLIRELGWTFLISCVIMMLCGAVGGLIFRREAHDRRAVLTNLCMVSNCGYMGYPVIIAAMGQDALIYAVVYSISFNLMCWTAGAFVFGGREAMKPRKLLSNPALIATLVGMALFLGGWTLPKFLGDVMSMLGATTTPLAMFVIGARLISLRPAHLRDTKLLLVCLLRLIVFPLTALALLRLTGLPRVVVNALYLCTAMPCAALTAMQTDLFRCDSDLASRGVALSTALSLLTLPGMLLLL